MEVCKLYKGKETKADTSAGKGKNFAYAMGPPGAGSGAITLSAASALILAFYM